MNDLNSDHYTDAFVTIQPFEVDSNFLDLYYCLQNPEHGGFTNELLDFDANELSNRFFDYDKDGDLDFGFYVNDERSVDSLFGWFENNGTSLVDNIHAFFQFDYKFPGTPFVTYEELDMLTGDMDNDGVIDRVLLVKAVPQYSTTYSTDEYIVFIFREPHVAEVFSSYDPTAVSIVGINGPIDIRMALLDVDQDGDLDIVVASITGSDSNSEVYFNLYYAENLNNGDFPSYFVFDSGTVATNHQWECSVGELWELDVYDVVDVDLDGKKDVVVSFHPGSGSGYDDAEAVVVVFRNGECV